MNDVKQLLVILLNATMLYLAAGNNSINLRRRSRSNDQIVVEKQDNRQRLRRVTCRLFKQDIEFEATDNRPYGYSEDRWLCELRTIRRNFNDIRIVEVVDAEHIISEVTPGKAMQLTLSEAIIDTSTATMEIPDGASYELNLDSSTRIASKSTGSLQTLVIRVKNAHGIGPDANSNKLRSDIFNDAASLSTQYNRCSWGKLIINAFTGNTDAGVHVEGGVVEVQVNYAGDDHGIMQNKAIAAATAKLGDLESDKYDLVIFAMPPQKSSWVAYAFGDSKYSFCHSKWCEFVSVQMHEVGHNLGLAHSGQIYQDSYSDQTGFMGFSYMLDDQFMCFNPAKSYQLQWYADQTKSLNPLKKNGDAIRSYKLNGVADYGKDKESLIVLRLVQKTVGLDYYIGFNRKAGINRDTHEDPDEVIIVRKDQGGPFEYGASTKIASLKEGETHIIRNFDNERDVEIQFIGAGANNEFAVIDVIDIERQREEKPSRCKPYLIEVQTDKDFDQNKWLIRDRENNGRVYARSIVYNRQGWYNQEICLPYGKDYRFDFYNLAHDGFYRGRSDPDILFEGKGNSSLNTEFFTVGADPDPDQNGNIEHHNKRCRNTMGRRQFLKKNGKLSMPKSCKFIAKRGFCDKKDQEGILMSHYCKNSCQKCETAQE